MLALILITVPPLPEPLEVPELIAEVRAMAKLKVAALIQKNEKERLEAMVSVFDQQFVDLVERIGALRGRVIISGMGKSGHICRKIAATMASRNPL